MSSIANFNKTFEGEYVLTQQGKVYSEEHFEVYEHFKKESCKFISEITTRLPTGEMLKINCLYEANLRWLPDRVVIKKSVGTKSVHEIFETNFRNNVLTYEYKSGTIEKITTKNMTGVFQISTPSFATSLICTQHKQVNSVGRMRYSFVVSQNDWEYTSDFEENAVYLASSTNDQISINMLGKDLQAKRFFMYKHDSIENIQEKPVIFYVSKHVALPYKIELAPGVEVNIRYLKKNEANQFDSEGFPIDSE